MQAGGGRRGRSNVREAVARDVARAGAHVRDRGATVDAGGRQVRVGKPDKVLFDDDAGRVTKRELAAYYRDVADGMLRRIAGHPVAVERFPDGVDAGGFMQKQRPEHAPSRLRGVRVPRVGGGSVEMMVCRDAADLVWLADQAAVTIHALLGRTADLAAPDRIIVDLDPPDDDFDAVRRAASDLHELLDELKLPAYPMTTGSRGLHVVVPIRPDEHFDPVRAVAGRLADVLAARHPDRMTTRVRKSRRRGRLFIDMLRNAYGQHAVAPYSVRPLPGAPVATPIRWAELPGIASARHWTLHDRRALADRIRDDPWHDLTRRAHALSTIRERVAALPG